MDIYTDAYKNKEKCTKKSIIPKIQLPGNLWLDLNKTRCQLLCMLTRNLANICHHFVI